MNWIISIFWFMLLAMIKLKTSLRIHTNTHKDGGNHLFQEVLKNFTKITLNKADVVCSQSFQSQLQITISHDDSNMESDLTD